MDLQDLRILRGPKMENRSPPGPKLCYLFQAGIPKIGLLGTFRPQIGQIDRVLTSSEVKIRSPKGEICLGTTDFGLPEAKIRVLGLGSGSPRPSNWPPRGQIWPLRGQKWPLGDPKSVSQTWKIDPIFLIFEMRKIAQFYFGPLIWDLFEVSDFWGRSDLPLPPPWDDLPLYALAGHRGP